MLIFWGLFLILPAGCRCYVTWEGTVSIFLHFQSHCKFPLLLLVYWPFPWSCYIPQLSLLEQFQRPVEELSVHEQVNTGSGSLKFPSTWNSLIASYLYFPCPFDVHIKWEIYVHRSCSCMFCCIQKKTVLKFLESHQVLGRKKEEAVELEGPIC